MRKTMPILLCAALAACGRGNHEQAGAGMAGQPARMAGTMDAPAPPNAQQPAAAPATPVSGQAVFGRTCVTCHQAAGQGLPGAFPPLALSPYANGPKPKLIRIALNGLSGPVTVGGKRFNGVMPPWKGQLSDAEIAAVLTYVRSSFGNHGDAVTADEVRQERAATASRSSPWTIAELDRSRD